MNCHECNHRIDSGDYYFFVKIRARHSDSSGDRTVPIHVQCITSTQGRTLKRQER